MFLLVHVITYEPTNVLVSEFASDFTCEFAYKLNNEFGNEFNTEFNTEFTGAPFAGAEITAQHLLRATPPERYAMSYDNPFFFFRTLWGALRHADWNAAAERGLIALVLEFFRTLMGLSAWPFFIPVESEWRPSAVRQILSAHGIESWGWGRAGSEFFFQVKLRQATWAQYLLQQHAVPLSGQLLDESKRSSYRPGPRRSLRPTQAATPTYPGGSAPNTAHTQEPSAPTSFLQDPVGQINNTIDRLAKW